MNFDIGNKVKYKGQHATVSYAGTVLSQVFPILININNNSKWVWVDNTQIEKIQ